MLVHSLTRN